MYNLDLVCCIYVVHARMVVVEEGTLDPYFGIRLVQHSQHCQYGTDRCYWCYADETCLYCMYRLKAPDVHYRIPTADIGTGLVTHRS